LEKKKQDLYGQAPESDNFVVTEQGSARFAALDGEGSSYKYETGPTEMKWGFRGPPWSVEPSMNLVCDEVGIDYDQFVNGLKSDKNDTEMAEELGVNPKTIANLRTRFYEMEAINGNYGQD